MPKTREKLIELLDIIIRPGQKTLGEIADHLIANGVTVQKWIPVTERLPETGVDVLCWYEYFRYGDYNGMYQTYGLGHYFEDGFWGGEVSNVHRSKVLAWMPLPEAPKADNADRCVCCGEIIPEGRQVCPNCERGVTDG